MKRLLTIVLWVMASTSFADMTAYNGIVRVWADSASCIALHFHDWNKNPRLDDPEKPDVPFSEQNRSAYVEVWSKTTGKKLWRRPTPAFTFMWVSPDGKYIVGMSNIKLGNPYQLVVFDEHGTIRLREHIAAEKAAFTADELAAFWAKFPQAKPILRGRVKEVESKYYVDFLVMNMPTLLSEEAWEALHLKTVPNPEFPYVGESPTNFVEWFGDNPRPLVAEEGDKTYLECDSTSLFGPSKRFRIEIPNNGPSVQATRDVQQSEKDHRAGSLAPQP